MKLTATWDVAGTPISRTVSLTVLEMRMAVDGGKHLDNINFEDYGSITDIGNFGNYQCAFWPNTDYDILHYENEYFPEPDAWLEDDCPTDKDADGSAVPQNWEDKFIGRKGKKSRTIHHHNGTDTIVYDSPADEDNHCPRDLEDFNRLHMKFDSLFANMDNVEFILSGNGVSINLFPATAPSLSYLKDLTEAEKQSRIQRLFTIGSTSVKLGKENITFGTNGNTVTAFLWEGCPQSGLTSSSGYIQLSVKIGNNLIGTRKVRIVLDDVSNFYDTWESSTIATPSILNGLLANMRGTGAHCLPNANDEYLLVCHGFNVDSIDKEHWPRTIFKRLWWQNYPGRMGFFSWPCVVKSIEGLSPSLYDESDQRAWQNGHHLKSLLAGLKDTGFNVHLLAHSQGNVVAGNALRLLEENKKIATYIASQAAISLSCYSHVSSAYFLLQKCPDVRAEYPLTLSTTDRKPFLDGIEKKADSLFNFFNTVDYALTSAWFISWKRNNSMRPDYDYDYEGDGGIYNERPASGTASQFYKTPDTVLLPLGKQKLFFPSSIGKRTNIDDTYEIFSRAAHAWGNPIGMLSEVAHFKVFPLQGGDLNYDKYHYSHSRQFRSNLPAELSYWSAIIQKCGLEPKGISKE